MADWLSEPYAKGDFPTDGTTAIYRGPVDGSPFLNYTILNNAQITSSTTTLYDQSIGIGEYEPSLPNLYGFVPMGGNFSYNPPPAPPPPSGQPIAEPPTSPLPLTTKMDYLNVVPDNGIDGIVSTPANLSTFGNDTGVIAFTAKNGMAGRSCR